MSYLGRMVVEICGDGGEYILQFFPLYVGGHPDHFAPYLVFEPALVDIAAGILPKPGENKTVVKRSTATLESFGLLTCLSGASLSNSYVTSSQL